MMEPSTVIAIAWKTSVLLVAIGLIVSLTARRSAAWRHCLWTSALALALLMPIAVELLPSYVQVTLPWETAEPAASYTPSPLSAGVREADAASEVGDSRPIEVDAATRPPLTTWRGAIIVWLIGVLVGVLRNAVAHVGLMRWVRNARPDLSSAWAAALRDVAGYAALRRPLRVLESDHTTSPCTFGWVKPVVLLPAAGADWPEAQRRFTLLHELAHVRRFDYLATQIASLACAVHWYNPLVWFAAVQVRKLQEHACDDEVLNAGGTPSDYAQFLVSIARGAQRPSLAFPAAIGMVQRSQLHGRVTAILDGSATRLPLSRLAFGVALAPLACLTFFVATLSASAAPIRMQLGVPLTASFSSLELRNGGTVTLIHGASQSVKLLKGDPEQASISIHDGGRLVIDRCPAQCPRNHDFEVEVVTPALATLAVAEGGTIQSRGKFPGQAPIEVGVSQGGTIDVRSMTPASVTASVESGGRIFVKPASAMSATVEQGGIITYWGDAVVESSVRHRGQVTKGTAADADKPLAELGPQPPPPPPPPAPVPAVAVVPPVPAVQPISR